MEINVRHGKFPWPADTAPEGVAGTPARWVEITDGDTQIRIPNPVVADVTAGRYRAVVTLRPDPTTGVFGVAGLEVDPPAPTSLLRALGMGKAAEEIIRQGSIRYRWADADEMPALGLTEATVETLRRRGAMQSRDGVEGAYLHEIVEPTHARRALSRGRARIPDEQVERAAEVYRAALAEGGQAAKRATATVAADLGISLSAAGMRVRLARERGLLGPAAGTKAGEAT